MSQQPHSRVVRFEMRGRGEVLVSRKRLATHFDVSERTIQRWQADGMPHLGRGHTVRYRVSVCEMWLERGR
jgi:phage terminase Nu1 subunit (DNA packaging protein)